jgi:homoserine O-acetyltransferase
MIHKRTRKQENFKWPLDGGFEMEEGNHILPSYTFNDGVALKNIILHYTTLGMPIFNICGDIVNAVLFLHGTSGSARNMLTPLFKKYMYGPDQPLDAKKYYIILPDTIGHGKSSKPSACAAAFPHYN